MRLYEILADDNLFTQLAASVLEDYPNVDHLAILVSLLIKDAEDELIINRCANLLGWIQTKTSINILIKNLHHSSSIVRESCVFVLGQIAERDSAEELILMLKDHNEKVRRMTATVIGWAGGDFHFEIMNKNNIFTDPNIFEEVKSILYQIGSAKAIQYLESYELQNNKK